MGLLLQTPCQFHNLLILFKFIAFFGFMRR